MYLQNLKSKIYPMLNFTLSGTLDLFFVCWLGVGACKNYQLSQIEMYLFMMSFIVYKIEKDIIINN